MEKKVKGRLTKNLDKILERDCSSFELFKLVGCLHQGGFEKRIHGSQFIVEEEFQKETKQKKLAEMLINTYETFQNQKIKFLEENLHQLNSLSKKSKEYLERKEQGVREYISYNDFVREARLNSIQ